MEDIEPQERRRAHRLTDLANRPVHPFFSVRSIILMGFVAYLLLGPVREGHDIIASTFAYTFLVVLLLLAVAVFLLAGMLRRTMTVNVWTSCASGPYSGHPVTLHMETREAKLPAMFQLRLHAVVHRSDLLTAEHVLTGWSGAPRVTSEPVVFPHRGRWRIKRIEVVLSDAFGIVSRQWEISPAGGSIAIDVRPPPSDTADLPLISSSFRMGDALPHPTERHGDPLELKPYHPSDGLKRLAWKLYAKSGALISRHPERAMTPEGQLVAFCLADEHEDRLAARTIAYLSQAERSELSIYFGCQGMHERRSARSAAAGEQLLIESIWHAMHSSPDTVKAELDRFLKEIREELPGSTVEKLALFVSARRLGDPLGARLIEQLVSYLVSLSVEPVFFVADSTPAQRTFIAANEEPALNLLRLIGDKLKPIFYASEAHESQLDSEALQPFLNLCGERRWEVILMN